MSKNTIKILFASVITGILASLWSSAFLYSLEWVTELRQLYPVMIWGLPVFGFLFALIVKKIPHHINQGVPYILEELENPTAHVSPWMAPFIFLSSLGTHLFGGSAGREGVGVVMGASLSHLIPDIRPAYKELRPFLIYSGIAAGFSSIFGTPLTAIIFSFELHQFKDRRKYLLVVAVTISSFSALVISHFLGPTHHHLHAQFPLDTRIIFYLLIAILTSAFGGQFFYWGLKAYTKLISKLVPHLEWKMFFGGLAVSILVYLSNSFDYIGIGTDVIEKSFSSPMGIYDFTMKCLLTVMTLAVGFKGGEVTPLFFMGATLSNGVASYFQLTNYSLSSSLGMVALFGAVTATPFASAMMGAELFGWKIGLLSLVCCFFARKLMGNKTVYRH